MCSVCRDHLGFCSHLCFIFYFFLSTSKIKKRANSSAYSWRHIFYVYMEYMGILQYPTSCPSPKQIWRWWPRWWRRWEGTRTRTRRAPVSNSHMASRESKFKCLHTSGHYTVCTILRTLHSIHYILCCTVYTTHYITLYTICYTQYITHITTHYVLLYTTRYTMSEWCTFPLLPLEGRAEEKSG